MYGMIYFLFIYSNSMGDNYVQFNGIQPKHNRLNQWVVSRNCLN